MKRLRCTNPEKNAHFASPKFNAKYDFTSGTVDMPDREAAYLFERGGGRMFVYEDIPAEEPTPTPIISVRKKRKYAKKSDTEI